MTQANGKSKARTVLARLGPPWPTNLPDGRVEPLLVEEPEARRLLGDIGERKLRGMVRNRQIPHVYIGTRLFFSVDALRAWVACMALASVPPYIPGSDN